MSQCCVYTVANNLYWIVSVGTLLFAACCKNTLFVPFKKYQRKHKHTFIFFHQQGDPDRAMWKDPERLRYGCSQNFYLLCTLLCLSVTSNSAAVSCFNRLPPSSDPAGYWNREVIHHSSIFMEVLSNTEQANFSNFHRLWMKGGHSHTVCAKPFFWTLDVTLLIPDIYSAVWIFNMLLVSTGARDLQN